MDSYVTDTQALIKFMMGQKIIGEQCHQAFLSADQLYHTVSGVNVYERIERYDFK